MRKRKTITPRVKLQILQRDFYKCTICGGSTAIDPSVSLEVDHILPFSKEGEDTTDNYQTLCRDCNRGKGNQEELNKNTRADINNLLDKINQEILIALVQNKTVNVVANAEDFIQLEKLNSYCNPYNIEIIPNLISGYHACYSLGIYTISDNYGQKTNFLISES